jgi:hypothetical protein
LGVGLKPRIGLRTATNTKNLLHHQTSSFSNYRNVDHVLNLKFSNSFFKLLYYDQNFYTLFSIVQVDLAAKCGAVGAILYNDPADSAPEGISKNKTYPKTWWLPPSGVQRGNLRAVKGDPLTPEVPAIDGIIRSKVEDVFMPAIPATPLPYGQAVKLLKLIKGWYCSVICRYNI